VKIHTRPEHQLWWTTELIAALDPSLAERLNVASDAQREGQFERADEILRHIIAEHALTELPVEILCPLPTRVIFTVWNRLGQATTVADLVRRSLRDLRRWKNFGKVSIALLGGRLRALGLNLTGQQDYGWISPLPDRLRERMLLIPPCVPMGVST
jgi:DNA-directed RNA polymerase alpha subunit